MAGLQLARHPFGLRHAHRLMKFVARLRELSGGKPVGFKFCVGHPWEWFAIVKAMLETGITPDFIVVDGAEGGTGAAPVEFVDHVGTPLREALRLVQHADRREPARPHQAGRVGQDHHRLRHGARDGDGRGLVQLGARLHVRHRLHPGPGLPHRQMPHWRHHAGSVAPARAGRARQGAARGQLPPTRCTRWPSCWRPRA